jgi:hypothetical protein
MILVPTRTRSTSAATRRSSGLVLAGLHDGIVEAGNAADEAFGMDRLRA